MNEKFQEYLMSILEKTGEFLGEELPEVANQILIYSLYEGVTFIVLGLILLAGPVKLQHWITNVYEPGNYDMSKISWYIVTGLLGYFPILIMFVGNLLNIFKILLAPKLYLLEYAASLVK